MDFCVLSRLDCSSASFGYPGPNLAESSFNLACVCASSLRSPCSSVSEPVTPADAPLSIPFPASPEIKLRIAVLYHLVQRALHDASGLCLLQLGGCLLQAVERGSEDLLMSLAVRLAKCKHSRVALQVDDFRLQILALLAQTRSAGCPAIRSPRGSRCDGSESCNRPGPAPV